MFAVIDSITSSPDITQFLPQAAWIHDGIACKGLQSPIDNSVNHRLRLERKSGFANAGAMAGSSLHGRDNVIRPATVVVSFDENHLRAVKDPQVNRFTRELCQRVYERPGIPIERQIDKCGVAELEKFQPETIAFPTAVLIEKADYSQTINKAMNSCPW